MKKTEKLMILISVVLVSLLAIGAVSAADADTTAIGDDSGAEPTVEPTTEEPVAEPEPIEKPEVTDAGTFEDLDKEIVGGQVVNPDGNVTLKKDYKNTDGHTIEIKEQQDDYGGIHSNLNLDGQNHIIDGNYNQTIFTIYSDMTVTMSNLIFINGNDEDGGAIVNYGDLTLTNVTFMSNWAEDYGGAIANYGKLTITNATFIENGAGGEYGYGLGGAIYNDAESSEFLKITNATFIDNSAIYGGAIYNTGFGLEINKVGFFDNFASKDGGAIYNDEDFITIIDDVVFDGNGATGSGGAIFTEGSWLLDVDVIEHAWFINNFAGEFGGAIWTGATIAAFNDTWFYNNTVLAENTFTGKPEGGAIYGYNLVLSITNSTFEENRVSNVRGSAGNGGAISALYVIIEDSGFEMNTAAKEGGAIKAASIYLNNTVFLENSATYGGAIFLYDFDESYESFINNTYFGSNFASDKGGAICSYDELGIEESDFNFNDADNGGAIYTGGKLTIDSSDFMENGNDKDYSLGGAIYIAKGDNGAGSLSMGETDYCSLENDGNGEEGSEIYSEDFDEFDVVDNTDVANVAGFKSIYKVRIGDNTKVWILTALGYEVVNNETGSVGIIVYMYDIMNNDDPEYDNHIYGSTVNMSIYSVEDGEWIVIDDEYTIGGIYRPEFEFGDLANGTYLLFIDFEGDNFLYESSFEDEEGFEVVNMTAVKEELESASYKDGKEAGTEETTELYEGEIIPEIRKGYEDQIKDKNATIKTLEEQNDVLEEGNFLLNATNQNLTAENKKLATEKDDANKALAAKNAEATQLTADKTNLQNQVNTLQGQVNTLQQQNTEASAKISKVKAASKVKKSKNFKITVTLSNNKVNGKYVYVSFNGKMYKAKVKNGKATITIKKSALKKLGGKTVKYQVVYDQSYKNKSVKVKK